jgi:peptide-methionine (R)-S-oxide reductase
MNWNDVIKLSGSNPPPASKVSKTKEEWKLLLTPEQFHITREHGTEQAFSGAFCELYEPGLYSCIGCHTQLFDSTAKFDSKTGWPSFGEPVNENVIHFKKDTSWGRTRIEVLCNICDAHLGHVFPDGPAPSGLRFCINSAALHKTDHSVKSPHSTGEVH